MLKMSEACQQLGVHRDTMRKLLVEGHIHGQKLPSGHWRVDQDSIQQFKQGNERAKALDLMRKKKICR